MSKGPTLVVLAAGMGSRYGGLKQMDPITSHGEWILDFSAYDALKAGFTGVCFVIKKEHEKDFAAMAGERISKHMDVSYCYQEMSDIPAGFSVPEGREKPWGTAHAVYAARDVVKGPFTVCNADDFYGRGSFEVMYDFLTEGCKPGKFAVTGFRLDKTLTEHGSVARGVCSVENGLLTGIVERTKIEKRGNGAAFTEDGETWEPLSADTVVSMNMWGFPVEFFSSLGTVFEEFLANMKDPLKEEYFLPYIIDIMSKRNQASVSVLPVNEQWHGVTYRADREGLVKALEEKKKNGEYPESLWG